MRQHVVTLTVVALLTTSPGLVMAASEHGAEGREQAHAAQREAVQLGPRPFYLVNKLSDSPLKRQLEHCAHGPFSQTTFSIGHRGGGTLQFPEHTKENHEAGARMGAGILECDVTFTSDGELVCRHDQCDLHTTTNILLTPLAAKCTQPFAPAAFDASGTRTKAASALCCTSDLTLAEFQSLAGKMDAFNPNATTPQAFQGGTPHWRTDLYATGATLLSHQDSIQLIKSLGAKFTPELKGPNRSAKLQVEAVFGSQEAYAQAMIDAYIAAGIAPKDVFAQSFNRNDILYWIQHEPHFGHQAVYLDDRYETSTPPLDPNDSNTWQPSMQELAAQGITIIAPPMWVLLTVEHGEIVPSLYAKEAKKAGLDIITWTLERSGRIVEEVAEGGDNFYYLSTINAFCGEDPIDQTTCNDGAILVTLDVLAKQVGVLGIFSDWAATVTYYANCMGLKESPRGEEGLSWGGMTASISPAPRACLCAGSEDGRLSGAQGCAQGSRAWNKVTIPAGQVMQPWPATIARPSHAA
jgi:glycerophosphoryl diester phosphodiesterase